jgi:signal transduction histidine kinase
MYSPVLPDGTLPANIVLMASKTTHSVSLNDPGIKPTESRKSSDRRWLVVEKGSPKDNRRKSDSVARLSHDIRTQLYIIIGFAELMLDEVPGKINDEQRCSLNDVLNSGKRLVNLLDDIVIGSESKSGNARDDKTQEEL